jgi:hypothetical protein
MRITQVVTFVAIAISSVAGGPPPSPTTLLPTPSSVFYVCHLLC